MKTSSTGRRLWWAPNFNFVIRTVLGLLFGAVSSAAFGQTTLENVVISPPSGADTRLRADFFLPQADSVSSINVTANGTVLDKARLTFTAAEGLENYSCAVLLVVDKTIGSGGSEKAGQRLLRAYLGRGDVCYKLKRYKDAVKDYTEAIRLDPKSGEAYQSRGNAYSKLGLDQQAKIDYAKAKELLDKQ